MTNPKYLQEKFKEAWYKFTTQDMGPRPRCKNKNVPGKYLTSFLSNVLRTRSSRKITGSEYALRSPICWPPLRPPRGSRTDITWPDWLGVH